MRLWKSERGEECVTWTYAGFERAREKNRNVGVEDEGKGGVTCGWVGYYKKH